MAKRTPQRGDNRDDLELKKFKYDPDLNESFVNIDDEDIVNAINSISGNTDTNPVIINSNLAANVESEIDCGTNVKSVYIRSRTSKELKLAYISGNTDIEYITIRKGCNFKDSAFYSNLKIYLLCEAADTVEILIQRNP
jgi:hypothetical protein